MMLFYPDRVKHISVSNHAKQRVLQRFRLFMFPEEKENPDIFIKRIFLASYPEVRNMNIPFFRSLEIEKYGTGCFRTKWNGLVLAGRYSQRDSSVIITTIWRNKDGN